MPKNNILKTFMKLLKKKSFLENQILTRLSFENVLCLLGPYNY